MAAAGFESDIPVTHVDVDTLLKREDAAHDCGAASSALWFLKHRHGVKGQGVIPVQGLSGLRRVCGRMDARVRAQFIVQAEVEPLLLADRRRCALRSHVLVDIGGGTAAPLAWHHRDVIVLPHAAMYDPTSENKAVHVSQDDGSWDKANFLCF